MDPDPVCSQRSDPDPVQISPDPQHCLYVSQEVVRLLLNFCSSVRKEEYRRASVPSPGVTYTLSPTVSSISCWETVCRNGSDIGPLAGRMARRSSLAGGGGRGLGFRIP
jgi:hypothetical protein